MTRAYIRLDPEFDENKADYPDGPYATLIAIFCLAEAQPRRGRFRSEAFLRSVLGRRGRHLRYLFDEGDLHTLPDGRVYVEGWDEWQEGDWKVGERVARIRNRLRPPRDSELVTPGVTVDVTPGVTVGTESGGRLDLLDSAGAGAGADKALTGGRVTTARPANGLHREKRSDDQHRAESVTRARSKLTDPASSADVKSAARFALHQMGESE